MAGIACVALTLWYTLRSFNPFTPWGTVPVSGHAFVERSDGLRCVRCGVRL